LALNAQPDVNPPFHLLKPAFALTRGATVPSIRVPHKRGRRGARFSFIFCFWRFSRQHPQRGAPQNTRRATQAEYVRVVLRSNCVYESHLPACISPISRILRIFSPLSPLSSLPPLASLTLSPPHPSNHSHPSHPSHLSSLSSLNSHPSLARTGTPFTPPEAFRAAGHLDGRLLVSEEPGTRCEEEGFTYHHAADSSVE